MPSTYTLNNGIELIGTGEQSGTWGDTTNTNLELLDVALDGQVTVTLPSAGTSGSPNALAISDGAASDGRNRMITFDDSSDLGATAYVQLTPNDAEKIIYVRNALSGSRSIILFQGTYNASNDYEVPAGTTAVIYFDGGGAGAVAANVFNNAYFDSLRLGSVSVTAILDEDNMASDSATALATQQSIKAYVDAAAAAQNELSEVLGNGNTTGGTDIAVSSGDDITFADSSKAIFGAGNDLQIYHDGTNSFVLNTVGELIIRNTSDDKDIFLQTDDGAGGSAIYIQADGGNGSVNLRHYGSIKLATTSTGIDVTGTVTADGLDLDGNIQGDDGQNMLVSAGEGSGDKLDLRAGDDVRIWVDGFNAHQKAAEFASNGDITFYDTSGNASFVYDESAGSTFNEQGDNKDFRVESDGNTHSLFVDASSSRVGINTSGPTEALDVSGTIRASTRNSTTNVYDTIAYQFSDARGWGYNSVDDAVFYNGADGKVPFLARTNAVVINESSHDIDFRVESDSNSNMFVVDAALNQVGVGAAPDGSATLDAVGRTLRAANIYTKYAQYSVPTATFVDVYWNDDTITLDTGYTYRFQLATLSTGTNTGVIYWVWYDDTDWNVDIESRHGTSSNNPQGRVDSGKFQIYHNHPSTYSIGVHCEARAMGTDDNTRSSIGLPGFITAYGGDGVVLNEDSNLDDFRVESNLNTHALFVDGADSRVSINKASAVADLDVGGSILIDNTQALSVDTNLAAGQMSMGQVSDSGGWGAVGLGWSGGAAGQTASFGYAGQTMYFGLGDGSSSGSLQSMLQMSRVGGESVFNNSGHNIDFRVESDSYSNALFVDAADNQVGVFLSSLKAQSAMEVLVAETSSVTEKSDQTDYADRGAFTIRRDGNSNSHALIMCGNDDIGSVIEQGRVNSGSTWETYLRFYNHSTATGSPTTLTQLTPVMQMDSNYLRMLSGTNGIQFNGDTAAANALDDYEEGTFDPVVRGRITAGTATYARQEGFYTKIGRTVTIHMNLGWSSHTGSGGMEITLPFSTGGDYQAGGFMSYNSGMSYGTAAGDILSLWMDSSSANMRVYYYTRTGSSAPVNVNTSVSEIHLQIIYNTA